MLNYINLNLDRITADEKEKYGCFLIKRALVW
jgi:hypothetical protein